MKSKLSLGKVGFPRKTDAEDSPQWLDARHDTPWNKRSEILTVNSHCLRQEESSPLCTNIAKFPEGRGGGQGRERGQVVQASTKNAHRFMLTQLGEFFSVNLEWRVKTTKRILTIRDRVISVSNMENHISGINEIYRDLVEGDESWERPEESLCKVRNSRKRVMDVVINIEGKDMFLGSMPVEDGSLPQERLLRAIEVFGIDVEDIIEVSLKRNPVKKAGFLGYPAEFMTRGEPVGRKNELVGSKHVLQHGQILGNRHEREENLSLSTINQTDLLELISQEQEALHDATSVGQRGNAGRFPGVGYGKRGGGRGRGRGTSSDPSDKPDPVRHSRGRPRGRPRGRTTIRTYGRSRGRPRGSCKKTKLFGSLNLGKDETVVEVNSDDAQPESYVSFSDLDWNVLKQTPGRTIPDDDHFDILTKSLLHSGIVAHPQDGETEGDFRTYVKHSDMHVKNVTKPLVQIKGQEADTVKIRESIVRELGGKDITERASIQNNPKSPESTEDNRFNKLPNVGPKTEESISNHLPRVGASLTVESGDSNVRELVGEDITQSVAIRNSTKSPGSIKDNLFNKLPSSGPNREGSISKHMPRVDVSSTEEIIPLESNKKHDNHKEDSGTPDHSASNVFLPTGGIANDRSEVSAHDADEQLIPSQELPTMPGAVRLPSNQLHHQRRDKRAAATKDRNHGAKCKSAKLVEPSSGKNHSKKNWKIQERKPNNEEYNQKKINSKKKSFDRSEDCFIIDSEGNLEGSTMDQRRETPCKTGTKKTNMDRADDILPAPGSIGSNDCPPSNSYDKTSRDKRINRFSHWKRGDLNRYKHEEIDVVTLMDETEDYVSEGEFSSDYEHQILPINSEVEEPNLSVVPRVGMSPTHPLSESETATHTRNNNGKCDSDETPQNTLHSKGESVEHDDVYESIHKEELVNPSPPESPGQVLDSPASEESDLDLQVVGDSQYSIPSCSNSDACVKRDAINADLLNVKKIWDIKTSWEKEKNSHRHKVGRYKVKWTKKNTETRGIERESCKASDDKCSKRKGKEIVNKGLSPYNDDRRGEVSKKRQFKGSMEKAGGKAYEIERKSMKSDAAQRRNKDAEFIAKLQQSKIQQSAMRNDSVDQRNKTPKQECKAVITRIQLLDKRKKQREKALHAIIKSTERGKLVRFSSF